jgi:hypothetical protein
MAALHTYWPAYNPDIRIYNQAEFNTNNTVFPILLTVVGYIGGLSHFIFYFSLQGNFKEDSIEDEGRNVIRWIDYGITSPITLFIIAELSGIHGFYTLYIITLVQFIFSILSWYFENRDPYTAETFAMTIGYIITVWVPIFTSIGLESSSTAICVIVIYMFILFMSFSIVYFLEAAGNFTDDNHINQEIFYPLLGMTSKIMMQWMFYVGLNKNGSIGGLVGGLTIAFILLALYLRRRVLIENNIIVESDSSKYSLYK